MRKQAKAKQRKQAKGKKKKKEEKMENQEKDFIQIDIMLLLRRIWEKKLIIILITLLFTAASLVYSLFVVTPQYTSTTRVYVVNQKDDKAITAQDVQLGTLLVKDYREIILSNKVMEDVISRNNLNTTPAALKAKLDVDAPKDTRIISISVRDANPQTAAQIANAVKEVSAEQIKEVTKIDDVTTLEEAQAASSPSSPNVPRNAAIATALGFILAAAGVVLAELLDDRIRRAEDIEEGMDLVLLGVIPDTKSGK